MSDWQVGQEVTVEPHWGGPSRVLRIVSVGKRFLKLEDGSEWSVTRGVQKGCADSWTPTRIAPVRPGDKEKIRRNELVGRISRVNWKNAPIETLEAVAALIGYEEKAR